MAHKSAIAGSDSGDRQAFQIKGKQPANIAVDTITQVPTKSWRDVLPIHPAADLFPLMSPDELKVLGEDIKAHGLTSPIVLWSPKRRSGKIFLLDGRNRLDALERLGLQIVSSLGFGLDLRAATGADNEWHLCGEAGEPDDDRDPGYASGCDPYAFVISANIHRRHLTAEQKRDLIAKVLKATPEKSNRQIAETVKVDHKTVGTVRSDLEARGEIPHVESRTDTKGRVQPARSLGTRHKCWQCGVRAPVGEVKEHNYAAYEDIHVWLHEFLVAAFEEREAAHAREAAAAREAVAPEDEIGPNGTGENARLRARIDELQNENRRLNNAVSSPLVALEAADIYAALVDCWNRASDDERQRVHATRRDHVRPQPHTRTAGRRAGG